RFEELPQTGRTEQVQLTLLAALEQALVRIRLLHQRRDAPTQLANLRFRVAGRHQPLRVRPARYSRPRIIISVNCDASSLLTACQRRSTAVRSACSDSRP